MDADKKFNEYLDTWPDAMVMYPTEGYPKLKKFFEAEDGDQYSIHFFMNDFLDFVWEASREGDPGHTCSEWTVEYFKTERGHEMALLHMHRHEPLLAASTFGVAPLKDIMDGFITWVIYHV